MNISWKTMNTIEKIAAIISCIILAFFIITKIFPLNTNFDVFFPCMSVAAVFQAVLYWRRNRALSVVSIILSVVFLAVTVLDIVEHYV